MTKKIILAITHDIELYWKTLFSCYSNFGINQSFSSYNTYILKKYFLHVRILCNSVSKLNETIHFFLFYLVFYACIDFDLFFKGMHKSWLMLNNLKNVNYMYTEKKFVCW